MSARRRAVAALTACVAALASAPSMAGAAGSDDDPNQEDPVTLIDAGDAALQTLLPGRPVAGQMATWDYAEVFEQRFDDGSFDGSFDSSFSFRLAYGETATVMSVAPDGTYVVRHHIDALDLDGDLPEPDELSGYMFEHRISDDGRFMSGIELDAGRGSEDPLGLFAHHAMLPLLAYPTEPVGPGARWSYVVDVPDSPFTLEITVACEVVEFDVDRFVLDVTWSEDVDVRFMGSHITGRISGSARVDGSLGNTLDVSTDLAQKLDLAYEGEAMTGSEVVEQSIVIQSTPYS